jgi:probable F420-dependent oxidoreductase
MELTRYGIWTTYAAIGEERAGEAAKLCEELGFGALWLGGSPQLPTVRPLLAATETLTIATGIVNVWHYDEPARLAAEYAALDAEFPGRLLVGIGIGHPEATSVYEKPLAKMTGFFDALDAASPTIPRERRCVAALGPKMLDLSAERSLGTHPYFVPPRHTEFARTRLGPGALVAPELACVVGPDPDRASARRYASRYLTLTNYTSNLRRFGFTEQDIANGGSDALVDAIVPQGAPKLIAAAANAHLDMGADHVCLQTVGVSGVPREQWTALAGALGL